MHYKGVALSNRGGQAGRETVAVCKVLASLALNVELFGQEKERNGKPSQFRIGTGD